MYYIWCFSFTILKSVENDDIKYTYIMAIASVTNNFIDNLDVTRQKFIVCFTHEMNEYNVLFHIDYLSTLCI